MNAVEFHKKMEAMVAERLVGPDHEENARITLRFLKNNLYSAVAHEFAVDLPDPGDWDRVRMNAALAALQDLGDEVMEKGVMTSNREMSKLGWRIRANAGHLRITLLADCGWQEIGKMTFRKGGCPSAVTPAQEVKARVSRATGGEL